MWAKSAWVGASGVLKILEDYHYKCSSRWFCEYLVTTRPRSTPIRLGHRVMTQIDDPCPWLAPLMALLRRFRGVFHVGDVTFFGLVVNDFNFWYYFDKHVHTVPLRGTKLMYITVWGCS